MEQMSFEGLHFKKWLTTKEAAAYLGTTVQAIRNRIHRNQLTPEKPFGKNGKCYFDRKKIDQLLCASRNKGGWND